MLYSLFFIFYFFTNTVEKFMINKSLIPKDLSSTQDKHYDYNSRSNSSIPQDSCIIITSRRPARCTKKLNLFFFFWVLFKKKKNYNELFYVNFM